MPIPDGLDRVIIIIGAARSGTKFLRDTLAAGHRVHIIPYDVNFIWRMDHESYSHDELPAEECNDALAKRIRKKLMKAAGISDKTGHALLVEKTVSNCLRVDFVHEVFPQARYIHLVRDGRAVVESACRQWLATPELRYLLQKARSVPLTNIPYLLRYAARTVRSIADRQKINSSWGPRYSGIDEDLKVKSLHEVCATQWIRCVEYASRALKRRRSTQVLTTRYEDLTTGTGEIERICDFLHIAEPRTILDAFSSTVRADCVEKWRTQVDIEHQRVIMPLLTEQLQRYGYGLD